MQALSSEKVQSFINRLGTDPSLKQEYSANPEKTLNANTAIDVKRTDVWIYRIVVTALSFLVVSIVIGVLLNISALQSADKVITILVSLGSAAIGALAGLLAPSPVQNT